MPPEYRKVEKETCDEKKVYFARESEESLILAMACKITRRNFLPEIRTYKSSEVSKLRNSINQCNPTTVQTNTFNMPATFLDIDWQKKRALKMLDLSSK